MTSLFTPNIHAETPDQRDMRKTLAEVLDKHADGPAVRAAAESPLGWDSGLWERLVELGLPALPVPEQYEGLGLGVAEAAIAWREMGRRLIPGPLTTTLVAGLCLASAGDEDSLSKVARGASVAFVDGFAASLSTGAGIGSEAVANGNQISVSEQVDGWALSGKARQVIHGESTDLLLVACPDGLFVVSGAADGVTRTSRSTMDQTRRLADITLDSAGARRVGTRASAERSVDLMLVALAVEAAAAAERILEIAVDHLLVRHQFDRPIGSFQALKHRCADHLVATRGASATAAHAVAVADGTQGAEGELAVMAPLAKLVAADTLFAVAADSIQLFGGIGITWEADPHLFFKRGKSTQWLACPRELARARLRRPAGLAR